MKAMQNKNVFRISAGGNHTWIMLDEFMPLRKNWRPPSPLALDHDRSLTPVK